MSWAFCNNCCGTYNETVLEATFNLPHKHYQIIETSVDLTKTNCTYILRPNNATDDILNDDYNVITNYSCETIFASTCCQTCQLNVQTNLPSSILDVTNTSGSSSKTENVGEVPRAIIITACVLITAFACFLTFLKWIYCDKHEEDVEKTENADAPKSRRYNNNFQYSQYKFRADGFIDGKLQPKSEDIKYTSNAIGNFYSKAFHNSSEAISINNSDGTINQENGSEIEQVSLDDVNEIDSMTYDPDKSHSPTPTKGSKIGNRLPPDEHVNRGVPTFYENMKTLLGNAMELNLKKENASHVNKSSHQEHKNEDTGSAGKIQKDAGFVSEIEGLTDEGENGDDNANSCEKLPRRSRTRQGPSKILKEPVVEPELQTSKEDTNDGIFLLTDIGGYTNRSHIYDDEEDLLTRGGDDFLHMKGIFTPWPSLEDSGTIYECLDIYE